MDRKLDLLSQTARGRPCEIVMPTYKEGSNFMCPYMSTKKVQNAEIVIENVIFWKLNSCFLSFFELAND